MIDLRSATFEQRSQAIFAMKDPGTIRRICVPDGPPVSQKMDPLAPRADPPCALRVRVNPVDGTVRLEPQMKKGWREPTLLFYWRARQDLNPRPPGS